jgi:DNA-binding transcriptional MerR regulator
MPERARASVLLKTGVLDSIIERMKPQELANLLNVDPATIRRWAREDFREFLSPNAQGGNSLHRSFDEHDVRVLAWVAKMRTQNIPTANIIDTLRSAQAAKWRDLPPLPDEAEQENIPLMPVDTALAKLDAAQEQYRQEVKALIRERDTLLERLSKAETDNSRLREKNDELTARILDLNNRLLSLLEKQQDRRE